MPNLNRVREQILNTINEDKHHIKHPIPRTVTINAVGKTLTDIEWKKYYNNFLIPKLQRCTERKGDGTVHFFGEYGLEAALILEKRFSGRFHFEIFSDAKENAAIALYNATQLGLSIREVHFKNGRNEFVNVNDKKLMDRLLQEAATVAELKY